MTLQDTACDICKLAAGFLQKFVDANATEDEAKSAVEKLCDILPGSAKNEVCMYFLTLHFYV